MGYESKFYIVEKTSSKHIDYEENGKVWAQVIATFNMSKIGSAYETIHKYPATDAYIYADDGNTEIFEDRYGDELIEIPIKDMIQILKDLEKVYPDYRRLKPFKNMLKGFDTEQWKDIVVLHYGY